MQRFADDDIGYLSWIAAMRRSASLAVATLAARLADVDAAAIVLREPSRFVVSVGS